MTYTKDTVTVMGIHKGIWLWIICESKKEDQGVNLFGNNRNCWLGFVG